MDVGIALAIAGLVAALLFWLLPRESLLPGAPISVSPRQMDFTATGAFQEGDENRTFAERYTLTVSNNTKAPVYGVWVELVTTHLRTESIVIKALPRDDAEYLPAVSRRADTHGFLMKDKTGMTSLLVAISRIAPHDNYVYEVWVDPEAKENEDGQVNVSVLKSGFKSDPLRVRNDSTGIEVMFPTALPKAGSVVGVVLFE